MERTASAMEAEGSPFQGVLFAGLMIKDGEVRLRGSAVHLGGAVGELLPEKAMVSREIQARLPSKHNSTGLSMSATPGNVLERVHLPCIQYLRLTIS